MRRSASVHTLFIVWVLALILVAPVATSSVAAYTPLQQRQRFLASDYRANSSFGSVFRFGQQLAVSDDGRVALVAVDSRDDAQVSYAGGVYVFTEVGGEYVERQILTPTETGFVRRAFGRLIALSGDGSVALISGAVGTNGGNGVYVYRRAGDSFVQTQVLSPSDNAPSVGFASGIALSRDGAVAVVGASGGAAYVFTPGAGGYYAQVQRVASPDPPGYFFRFGYDVALSADGSTLVVGDTGYADERGIAYVFSRGGAGYAFRTRLLASDGLGRRPGESGDGFGTLTKINGNGDVIAVGALPRQSRQGLYVYMRDGDSYREQKLLGVGVEPGVFFGYASAVSVDGTTVYVGGERQTYEVGGKERVFVFERMGATYTQVAELVDTRPYRYAGYGRSLASAGGPGRLLVGAPSDNEGSAQFVGAVFVLAFGPVPVPAPRPGTGGPLVAPVTPRRAEGPPSGSANPGTGPRSVEPMVPVPPTPMPAPPRR